MITTDYIILTVNAPSFEENIELMINTIIEAGGTSSTIVDRVQKPMVGTKEANGRIMLHFRLPAEYTESELIEFLEAGMDNPKPPISVESIRSAYKIDGSYKVGIAATKAKFLPYLTEDEFGKTNNFLATYYGTDPIELTGVDVDNDGLPDTVLADYGIIRSTEDANSVDIDTDGDGTADIVVMK